MDLEPITRTHKFKPLYYAAARGHVAVSRLLVEKGNFMRQLVAGMAVGMAATGGGFGYASYRVEDVSKLQQQKKTHLEKAAQCRQLADVCRKLVDCCEEHASDAKARQESARMLKDQLGLP